MKAKKIVTVLISVINILGIICLVYFAIPYITHNTTVSNPDAMLPAEAWDAAGMTLTLGLVPLFTANLYGFIFVKLQKKVVRILWFVPSIICAGMVMSYWIRN